MHGFQPAAEHPTDLLQHGLRLKNLRLIGEFQFQAQSQLQHARFLVGACPDEVARLERFRRILRHDEFGEQMEDGIFDALPKRKSPSLVQVLGDVDNLLVEIVCPIDDG